MISPWTVRGMFRVRGDPNLVQVQFGAFSRPVTEREYAAAGYEPAVEVLPWKSVKDRPFGELSCRYPSLTQGV